MYKKPKSDINTADDEYKKEIQKMFPAEESLEQKADNYVLNEYYHFLSGVEPDDKYEVLVQEELKKLQMEELKYKQSMRVIKTARTVAEINDAVDEGYIPLIKQVIPSDEIRVMYSLEKDLGTGKVEVLSDTWEIYNHIEGTERVIDEVYYYPYHFPSPFAAYLIPPDIQIGERVIMEDLIEDIVSVRYEMNTYRLESAEAVWDGEEFVVDFDDTDVHDIIG